MKCSDTHSSHKRVSCECEGLPEKLLLELEKEPWPALPCGEGGDEEGGMVGPACGDGGSERGLGEVGAGWNDHSAASSRQRRKVGLVLLNVVQAVDVQHVNLQLPEVFGEDTRPRVQDAPQIGFGQLLPVVQGDGAL